MCGIVGFLDYERRFNRQTMAALVTAMADSIAHRGPDDAANVGYISCRVSLRLMENL